MVHPSALWVSFLTYLRNKINSNYKSIKDKFNFMVYGGGGGGGIPNGGGGTVPKRAGGGGGGGGCGIL